MVQLRDPREFDEPYRTWAYQIDLYHRTDIDYEIVRDLVKQWEDYQNEICIM